MFGNFNIDKRTLYFVLGIIVLFEISGYLNNPQELLGLLLAIPGIIIAITFHEFAHAKTADLLGDDTPRYEGRLTLNPLDHIEPVGFIMLIFAGFGWGKPVHVNPRNYNRTMSMEKADSIVSIAGPLTNFILAIVFTIIYSLIIKFVGFTTNTATSIIILMLQAVVQINIGLGVFNLIPLPPLDGSKVIKPFLTYNAKQWFERNEKIFYVIFIVLWITGIAGRIISPVIGLISDGLFNLGGLIIR